MLERKEIVQCLLYNKRIAAKAHIKYLNTPREYGEGQWLYMNEVHFITAIDSNECYTIASLMKSLSIQVNTAMQLANRLELKGYILKVKSEEDAANTKLYLTDLGQDIKQAHLLYDEQMYMQVSDILAEYSCEELCAFTEYEKKMAAAFAEQ